VSGRFRRAAELRARRQSDKPVKERKATADRRFVTSAANDNLAEVQFGKLAAERGKSDEVKKFGERMATDHQKAYDELNQIASMTSLNIPSEPGSHAKKEHDRLRDPGLGGQDTSHAPGAPDAGEGDERPRPYRWQGARHGAQRLSWQHDEIRVAAAIGPARHRVQCVRSVCQPRPGRLTSPPRHGPTGPENPSGSARGARWARDRGSGPILFAFLTRQAHSVTRAGRRRFLLHRKD